MDSDVTKSIFRFLVIAAAVIALGIFAVGVLIGHFL